MGASLNKFVFPLASAARVAGAFLFFNSTQNLLNHDYNNLDSVNLLASINLHLLHICWQENTFLTEKFIKAILFCG